MRQVKLTLPDDVADWLDNELGASHGTRGTVAGDIVQAAYIAFKKGARSVTLNGKTLHILYGQQAVVTASDS